MTVLTTAILEDEKKPKLDDETTDAAAIPVVLTTKGAAPVTQVHNRRAHPSRNPCRVFLFVITFLGLLCALGGVCYGIYHFARIGHNRPRVFCRIIENRPIRRSRMFSERAEFSSDRHSVRLFVPNFLYAQRVFSSSVVLILEKHGITVIRLEKSRTCFVKRVQPRQSPFIHSNRFSLPKWYQRVEDGSYLPNLTILRRTWMAKAPHMSHEEAGVVFHPKVAEFCQDMKVFKIIETHDRIGVVSYGGGLLPRCPLRKCLIRCPGGHYVINRAGCPTCQCKLPPPPPPPPPRRSSYDAYKAACGPFRCGRICPQGFATNAKGCPRCECKGRRIAKREAGSSCRLFPVTEGIDPVNNAFQLDEITLC